MRLETGKQVGEIERELQFVTDQGLDWRVLYPRQTVTQDLSSHDEVEMKMKMTADHSPPEIELPVYSIACRWRPTNGGSCLATSDTLELQKIKPKSLVSRGASPKRNGM